LRFSGDYAKSLTMIEPSLSPLAGWESFYVIVGSSAAALTGLNFVVVALGADRGLLSQTGAVAAFSTPTIVHFCSVLLLSAGLSAPWPDVSRLGWAIGLGGAAGLVYVAIVLRRTRRQKSYEPVLEDWIWHVTLPFAAYAAMLVGGLVFQSQLKNALFIVAGAALLLLYVGIHNAWDAAAWLAVEKPTEPESKKDGVNRPTGSPPPAG
jgi:hypothetical protein